MAEKNKLAQIPSQQMPERPTNFLSRMADEAIGAFERYGRRSGAQRDASLALLNQAVDPNTDPLTGAGQKLLGLAGLVTHPLAFFPTREEWDQRLEAAGNTGRMSRSIGGFLSDLPNLIDPQMAAGGAALAAAPLVGKLAGGKKLGDLLNDATDAELAALKARLEAEAMQTGGEASGVSREEALKNLTEAATPKEFRTQRYKEVYPDGTVKFAPGTLRVNPPAKRFNSDMSIAERRQLGDPPKRNEMRTQSYKEHYDDGTEKWVPGTYRVKRN